MVQAAIPPGDPTAPSRQHNALLPLVTISSGSHAARAQQAEVLLMHHFFVLRRTAYLHDESKLQSKKQSNEQMFHPILSVA